MAADRRVPETGIVLGPRPSPPARAPTRPGWRAGALDAREVQDNIVVRDRGTTARVDKSVAVAGPAASAWSWPTSYSTRSTPTSTPCPPRTSTADADAVRAYVRDTEDPTASIDPSATDGTPVPQIADFSSRGLLTVGGGDLLKPDLIPPGVSVAAAVAPPSSSGHLRDLTRARR